MPYDNNPAREASIIAQTAAKVAAQVYAGTGDLHGYLDAVKTIHDDIIARATAKTPTDALVTAVSVTGTSGVPQNPQAVAQQPTMQQAVDSVNAVFGITSASPEDDLWADVFNNPQDWWDNHTDPSRSTLAGGNGPDFRHKTLEKNGRNLGLWLYSRRYNRSAPDFVFQKLGVANPATLAQGNPPPTSPQFQTPQQAPQPPAPQDAPF